jgi:hypothetical protein
MPAGYTAMALYLAWSALDVNASESCSEPFVVPGSGVQLKYGVQAVKDPTCTSKQVAAVVACSIIATQAVTIAA